MIFAQLRPLVYLRRLTRAVERIADSQETIARVTEGEWTKKYAPRKLEKNTEFGVVDVNEVNKRFRMQREAEESGMDIPE